MRRPPAQLGAALLMALLTVALVAALASSALWLQWRQAEIESAERGRVQIAWLMTGALDWARLILVEDAKAGSAANVDHLGEPWALQVQESRLSTFLSQDQQWREGDPDVYLGGGIVDAQSRMNVMNLLESDQISRDGFRRFARLFERLGIPLAELQMLAQQLHAASASRTAALAHQDPPLMPQQVHQLAWLGLQEASLSRLAPFITVLPETTPVNLNTASAEVLYACLQDLDMVQARQLVSVRNRGHWPDMDAARKALGPAGQQLDAKQHALSSRFFEIWGRMRIDDVVLQETALVQREGTQVRMLWRRADIPFPQPSSFSR